VSRIDERFAGLRKAGRTGLVTYVTAGDPDLERSAGILRRLDAAGADVLEIGVPFSDPLADGPVIQRATERALAAGATLTRVLGMLKTLRPSISAPVVIFSYANPILRMGLDAFVAGAKAAGVDGVLTLDMPPEEGETFRAAFTGAGIDTIFLLSPTTTAERIRRAATLGGGFLYGISRLGVTGVRDSVDDSARILAERVKAETAMPLALGFGISRLTVIAEHGASPALLDEVERYVRWLRS
jgi:tryptophan synthase alpha chain